VKGAVVFAAALLVAAARGQAPPVEIVWRTPAAGIAVGEPFECHVRCALQNGERLELDLGALWPVSLEPPTTVRDADGTTVLRHRAIAFAAGRLEFAPVVVQVHGPSGGTTTNSAPPPLVVRSILADPRSPFEWPGDVRDAPRHGARWWWFVVPAVLAWWSIRWWRRPRSVAEVAPPAATSSFDRTAARLRALALPHGEPDLAAFAEELTAIVRDHASERFAIAAAARTTDELLTAVGGTAAKPLRECLALCDLVKFAAHRPVAAACVAARDAALAFARATAEEAR